MSRETVDLSARIDEPHENGNPADFPVTTCPLFYGESYRVHRVPDRRAIVREDTGQPLAVVSDQYTLIPHGRLTRAVEAAIAELELGDVPRGIYVDRDGARMRALYKFPKLARPVHTDDPICPCVKLQNSYDRSLRAAVHIGAFRFVCTNLAVGGGGVFAGGFVTLHRGEIPVENVTEQLTTYLDGFDEIVRTYRHWDKIPLDWDRLARILEPMPQHAEESIRTRLAPGLWTTVYDGYNAATRYATHKMSSYRSAFRLLKQINEGFQNEFPPPSSNGGSQNARDDHVPGFSLWTGAGRGLWTFSLAPVYIDPDYLRPPHPDSLTMPDRPWKLSPSDFAFLWEECPRCFWLKVREGFRRPWTPFPKIFNVIDEAMKAGCAGRRLDELAPGAPEATVVYGERWVESAPVAPPGSSSRCFVRGKFDTLARFEDGSYALVDFKTSERRSEHIPLYSRQLHAYAHALEHPAPGEFSVPEVPRLGLLVYEPELFTSSDPGFAALDGRLAWIEVERDDDAFREFLVDVTRLLDREAPPAPGEDCGFCSYREETRRRTAPEDMARA